MVDRAESCAHVRHLPVESVLHLLTHPSFRRGNRLSRLTSRTDHAFSCGEEVWVKLTFVILGLLRLQAAGLLTSILDRGGIVGVIVWNFRLRSVFIWTWVITWGFFEHRTDRAELRFILSTSCILRNSLTWALFRAVAIGTFLESHIVVWLGCRESGDREHKFLAIFYYIFTELRWGLERRRGLVVSVIATAFTLAIDAFMFRVV